MRLGQPWKPPCKFVLKSLITAFFELRSIYNSASARENTVLSDFNYEFMESELHGENTDLADLCYEFT